MGGAGAPAFNTVRLAMDWSYFQKQSGSSIVIDDDAFAQLDSIIDEAIEQGLYVILDPMHLSNVGTASNPNSAMCREDPVMAGAHKGIPAWAWTKVGATPGTSCESSTAWDALADDALGAAGDRRLPEVRPQPLQRLHEPRAARDRRRPGQRTGGRRHHCGRSDAEARRHGLRPVAGAHRQQVAARHRPRQDPHRVAGGREWIARRGEPGQVWRRPTW